MSKKEDTYVTRKGLTATIVFQAESLNYDEGFGNTSTLKKIRRGDGETYTFASRQSLRYSIFKQGKDQFGWKEYNVENKGSGNKTVIQASEPDNVTTCEEADLFGYMKTNVGKCTITRVAPTRITPAISLEPFTNDLELLTNKGQADKMKTENINMANMENHKSYYTYTLTIDLDRIGSEKDTLCKPENAKKERELIGFEINTKEKIRRVTELLEVIKTLYRDIRGRRENLNPVVIIAGVYNTKNPFFMNSIKLTYKDKNPIINGDPIEKIIKQNKIESDSFIGWRDPIIKMENISLKNLSPEGVIDELKSKVTTYYEPSIKS